MAESHIYISGNSKTIDDSKGSIESDMIMREIARAYFHHIMTMYISKVEITRVSERNQNVERKRQ